MAHDDLTPDSPDAETPQSAAPAVVDAGYDARTQFAQAVEAARKTPGGRVRVRLLLQLYEPAPARRYVHWKGQTWGLSLDPAVEVGHGLWTCLDLALEALCTLGPQELERQLRESLAGKLPLGPMERAGADEERS